VAGAHEIAAATGSARMAGERWRHSKPDSRRRILAKVATRLEAAAPQLARQMAIEIGKPVSHGLEEVRRAAANVRDVIRRASTFEFLQREPAGLVRHAPLGMVALIS